MDAVPFYQSYEFYITRVNAMMLAEAQLIWFNPDGLNVEMLEEPHYSTDGLNVEILEEPHYNSVVSVLLATFVDFQYMEFTDSLQQLENINLLDKEPETTDFKNGFAKIGVGDEEFAKPVRKMFVENNAGEIARWTGWGTSWWLTAGSTGCVSTHKKESPCVK